MNIGKFDLFYSNKQHNHPVLGHIDCNALKSSYSECINLMGIGQSQVYCIELFEVTSKCYKSQDSAEFNSWVDQKLNTRNKLIAFLNERNSTIPASLKQHNPWGMYDPQVRKATKDAMEVKDEKFLHNLKRIMELDNEGK